MSDILDEYMKEVRARNMSPNTVAAKEELLSRADRQLPHGLDEATASEIREWLGRPGLSGNTRRTYWAHFRAYFRFCTKGRMPYLDWNPMEDIPRPHVGRRLPRAAHDDQIRQALGRLDPLARRAVILAAGEGMRAAEIAAAEREHFTAQRVQVLGKGDKMRTIPTMPEVWAEVRGEPAGRLLTIHGEPVTPRDLGRTVARALDRAGLPRLTLHWFRGAYATRLLRAGVDVTVISRLLGHASVQTTMLYLDIGDDDLDYAVAKLPPLVPSQKSTGARAGY